MNARKLYLLWSVAFAISCGIGALFYLSSMRKAYGSFSGNGEFSGLVYSIEAFILVVFCTGIMSALLVLISKDGSKQLREALAKRLAIFYSIFALFCVATFNFSFIYLNPLGLVVFAVIPRIALEATNNPSQSKQNNWLFIGMLAAILVLGALMFLNFVVSAPR